jgi:hypothetical protein
MRGACGLKFSYVRYEYSITLVPHYTFPTHARVPGSFRTLGHLASPRPCT